MSVFFFSSRRRHTRWTGDWSSDVCSSDLAARTRISLARPVDRAWTATAFSPLLREELEGRLDELVVVLEDSAVAGVRVDHQLVVRQTSGHVEGVRRRQHPVVIAVREEYGVADA